MTIPGLRRSTAILTLPLLAALAMPATAQTLQFWDSDPSTGGVQGGAGTWNDTDDNFRGPNPGGVVMNRPFSNGDGVIFSGTGGRVTIANGTSPGVSELRFTVDGYVLSGDEIRSQQPLFGTGPTVIDLRANARIESDLDGEFAVETPAGPAAGRTLILTGANADLDQLAVGQNTTVRAGDVGGNVAVDGGGNFFYTGTVGTIESGGSLTAADANSAIGGDLDVTGGTALLQGTVGDDIAASGGATVTVGAGNSLDVTDDVDLTGAGTQLIVRGDLEANTVEGTAGTTIRVNDGATVTADVTSGGSLFLSGAADGVTDVDGDVTTTGGSARIQGDIDGDVTLGAGTTVTQTDAVTITGRLDNDTDFTTTDDVSADFVRNTGDLDVDAGTLTITGGTPLQNEGMLTVGTQVAGSVTNRGNVTVEDGGDVDGTLVNAGGLTPGTGTILGNVDGDVVNGNGGTLTFGSLTDDGATVGGEFRNFGNADFFTSAGGQTVITGNIINGGTGGIGIAGNLDADIQNSGLVTLDGTNATVLTGDITGSGDVTATGLLSRVDGEVSSGGTVTVGLGDGLTVRDGTTVQSGGTLDVDGLLVSDVTVDDMGQALIDGAVTGSVTSSGTLTLDGSVSADVTVRDGTSTLAGSIGGELAVRADGEVTDTGALTVTGAINNAGAITTGGAVDADGGLLNSGTFTVGTGTTTTVTGSARNTGTGTLTVDGILAGDGANELANVGDLIVSDTGSVTTFTGVDNAAVGSITIQGSGEIAADIDNRGMADLDGTVTGSLDNRGTSADADVAGDVTGGVVNRGGASLDFDGTSVVGGTGVSNSANLDVTGTVTAAGGVRNTGAGDLSVFGEVVGDVTTSADFDLMGTVTGSVDATGGTADLEGVITGDLSLDSSVTASQTGILDIDGTFDNDTAFTTTADLIAGTVDTSGDLTISMDDSLLITDPAGEVANTGDLVVAGSIEGDVTSTAGSVELTGSVFGNLDIDGGIARLAGDVDVDLSLAAGVTATQTGALDVTGTFDNDTTFVVRRDMEAGDVDNSGDLTVAGTRTLEITGGLGSALANTGDLTVAGTVDGDVGSTAGSVALTGTVTGNLDVTGGTAALAGDVDGDLSLAAGVTATQTDALDVDGAFINDTTFVLRGDVDAGSAVNTGVLTVGGTRTLEITGAGEILENSGALTIGGTVDGDVDSLAGSVALTGTVTGDLEILDGTASLAGDVEGDLSLAPSAVVTQTGTLDVDGLLSNETTFTTTADVDAGNVDTSGTLTVDTGTTLEITTGAGEVANTGDLTVAGTVDGDVTSTAGSVVLTGTVTGDLGVTAGDADLEGNVEGDLALGAAAIVTQTGALDVDGTLDNDTIFTTTANVDAGSVDNSGDLTVDLGTTLAITDPAGTLANTGALVVTGTVDGDVASSGGSVALTGTVTGDLGVTAGAANLEGDVDGDLLLGTGVGVNQTGALDVDGTVDNDTTFVVRDDLDAGDVDNSGVLTVANGTTLTVTDPMGSVASTGALLVRTTGTIVGDVDVQGGTGTVDGRIDGDLDTAGQTSVAGVVTGNVISTDGNLDLTGQVDQSVTISGGMATVAGSIGDDLSIEGVAVSMSGDLTVADAVTIDGTGGLTVGNRLDAQTVDNAGDLRVDGGTVAAVGAVTSGGTLTVTGTGTVTADTVTTTGMADIDGSVTATTLTNDGMQLDFAGDLTGDLSNASGTTVLETGAMISGDVANEDQMSVTGLATANSDFANRGDLSIDATGTLVTAELSNEAGTLDLDGALTGMLDNDATANVAGSVSGAIDNSGTLVVDGAASAATVTSSNDITIDATSALTTATLRVTDGTGTLTGDLVGALINDGDTSVAGGVTGNTINRDQLTVTATGALDGNLTNANGGTLTAAGTIGDGGDTLSNSGVANLNGATVNGALRNFGTGVVDVAGDVSVTNAVTNLGNFGVTGGTLQFGSFQNDATLTVGAAGRTDGGTLTNTDTLNVAGEMANAVTNTGMIFASDGAIFSGGLTQNGEFFGSGNISLSGGTTLATGSVTSLQQDPAGAVTYDVLDVTGPLNIDSATLAFDIDLTDGNGGGVGGIHSDFLRVRGGALTGEVTLSFAVQGTPGALNPTGILIIDADDGFANSYTFNPEVVAGFGALVYRLEDRDEDTFVVSAVNPAVGGLSGTISLTQSLIGQVVNRPSSPFVSALVAPDGDACSVGAWSRVIGGTASANGGVNSALGSFSNSLDASYGGLQLGADFGCVDGGLAGFDVTYGATAGYTTGTVTQDVFGFDPVTGTIDPTQITAAIENSFGQSYLALYAAASRGPLVADLQYRIEKTSFDIATDSFVPGGGVGVLDQGFDSDSQTLSGSVSYVLPFGAEESGWVFVPTAGFAFSKLSTDDVQFAGGGRVTFEDTKTQIGFVGASIARTQIAADDRSALTYFGTATYYGDFSDDLNSTFFDGVGGSEAITVENLGDYGEVSVGLNYVRILNEGQVGPARQLNGSIRLDGRLSDRLDSVGITAQVRLQF